MPDIIGSPSRFAFGIFALISALAECSPAPTGSPRAAAPNASEPREMVTLKAGTLATVGDAGWWVGIDQGYFREQGIQLDYETFDSAAAMVAPLSSGQLDVGGGAIS